MPIASSDLVCYSAANVPEDDTATSGGAIDTAVRPAVTQWTANAVAAVVSDGADVRTVTITGRDAAGAIVSEPLVLNGAAEVVGVQVFERVLKVVVSAADAARTVSIKQGGAGTVRATIGPNETKSHIQFQRSASAGAQTKRYEKQFWKNAHGTLTLTGANVTLTADPVSRIKIGLATAVNDTGSVTNRTTAPAGVTFVDDGVAQNVPGADLAAGQAIGVWIEQTLAGGDTPQKSTFTTQLGGNTT